MKDGVTGLKAQETDRKLVELARYEATRGGLRSVKRDEVIRLFRELKRMVMTRSEDLDELEVWVMGRWGYPQAPGFTLESVLRAPAAGDLARMPKAELLEE